MYALLSQHKHSIDSVTETRGSGSEGRSNSNGEEERARKGIQVQITTGPSTNRDRLQDDH